MLGGYIPGRPFLLLFARERYKANPQTSFLRAADTLDLRKVYLSSPVTRLVQVFTVEEGDHTRMLIQGHEERIRTQNYIRGMSLICAPFTCPLLKPFCILEVRWTHRMKSPNLGNSRRSLAGNHIAPSAKETHTVFAQQDFCGTTFASQELLSFV